MRSNTRRLAFVISLILLWEILGRLGWWPDYLFPAPSAVGEALLEGFCSGRVPQAILASIRRLLWGYSVALVIGIPVGVLMGRFRFVAETVGVLALGVQTLPSIAWLPLAILWFGLDEKAIVFVVVIGALFSIVLATASGMESIPPVYVRVARNMGATGIRLYTGVLIPAAFPSMLAGMKLGWAFAWRSLMSGELLSSGSGLGQLLMFGRDLADMALVAAVMVVIVVLGFLFDCVVFRPAEKAIRVRWGLGE